MAATGSAEYVALAALLALMAAAFLIAARIVGLGFLADFLSRTVLVGFLTGVGIQVALGEVPRLLGIWGGPHGSVAKLSHAMRNFDQISDAAPVIAVVVQAVIIGCRRISGKIPGPLIAVSQLAQIATTVIVLLVLLFLTGPLAYLPDAVLSAVVFVIGINLIDAKGMRKTDVQARSEFWSP